MVSPLSVLLLVLFHVGEADNPPPLPGTQLVGQAFDILTTTRFGYTRSAGNIFQFKYNLTTQIFDQEYSYPWGMQQPAPVSDCQRTVTTLSVKTMKDYRTETTDSVKVGMEFKALSGSYSTSTKEVREHLSKHSLWVSESSTKCVKYEITLLPGYAEFDPMFLSSIKALPMNFSRSSPDAYFNFFNKWNTHFMTRCSVGGAESALAYTESSYTKNHSEEDVQKQASLSFIISIDHEAGSSTSVDKEFSTETTFAGTEIHGGTPTEDEQWATWMQSVLEFKNPVCLDGEAINIADAMIAPWTEDRDLHIRAPAMKEALLEYFHRPGCTNPLFPNYDEKALQDDGSCGPRVRSLKLRATINGVDRVIIGNGNELKWQGTDATIVDLNYTMEDGRVHTLAWYPQQSQVFTSPFPLDYCAAARFTAIKGLGTIEMEQTASSDNEWTTWIFFNSLIFAGWYECELSWKAEDACHPTSHFQDVDFPLIV